MTEHAADHENQMWLPILPDVEPAPVATAAARPSLGYRIADRIASAVGMCGHGAPGNVWVRVSDHFFIDCPCCLFWRGAVVGGVSGAAVAAAALVLWHALNGG